MALTPSKSPTKVNVSSSPRGEMGQRYLAAGSQLSMRMWQDEEPNEPKPATARDYETVGFVIKGRAELHLDGQVVALGPGDSWSVPAGTVHTYRILETFTAIEATSPPAQAQGRDQPRNS